jgi:hypothetical protein
MVVLGYCADQAEVGVDSDFLTSIKIPNFIDLGVLPSRFQVESDIVIPDNMHRMHKLISFCVDATSRPAGITVIFDRRPPRQNKGEPSSCLALSDDMLQSSPDGCTKEYARVYARDV